MVGIIYDYYGQEDFKFVGIKADTDQVILGHHTTHGWAYDKVFSKTIDAGVDYKLTIAYKGTTVSVLVDDQAVGGYVYNALLADGDFGLFTADGSASFDNVTVKTDDPAFSTQNLMASSTVQGTTDATASITSNDLNTVVKEAISRWSDSVVVDESTLALLNEVSFEITDLQGPILGQTNGKTVLIDNDAAGYGWFIDKTPSDDEEFSMQLENRRLLSTDSSPTHGDMDLLTVVMHEMGHVIGLDHTPKNGQVYQIMNPTLDTSMRITLADLDFLSSDDDSVVKDKYQVPINTSRLSSFRVNNKVNNMQKTQTLVFDELMGSFSSNGKKQSLASHYYNQLKFDPSEWKGVRVSDRDNYSDWIIEV
jgi:hypothetical protein